MKFFLHSLFLILLPLSCEGGTITMEMAKIKALGSDLEIKCAFTADDQVISMCLHSGNFKIGVLYIIQEQKFKMIPNTKVTLEIATGSNVKKGSFIFTLKSLSSNDFTWYMFTVKDKFTEMKSQNQTLLRAGSDIPRSRLLVVIISFLACTFHLV